jgi:alpha-N-acetylglucosamine transferase
VQQKYTNCLKIFLASLKGVGYAGEIVILTTADTPERQLNQIQQENVVIKTVPKISAKKAQNKSLLNMLTKLHVWALTDYTQVMFFDSDFIFLHNPATAFDLCGLNPFCACSDTGIKSFSHGKVDGKTYFNSGFMVVRPSSTEFQYLLTSTAAAENTQFVDQDMLNNVYQGRWKKLDSKYNVMHVDGPISNSAVAIHEKLWIMQKKYPTGNWIWNKEHGNVDPVVRKAMRNKMLRRVPKPRPQWPLTLEPIKL